MKTFKNQYEILPPHNNIETFRFVCLFVAFSVKSIFTRDKFSFCGHAKLWWKHSFAFKATHKLSTRSGKCVKAIEIRPGCGNLYLF